MVKSTGSKRKAFVARTTEEIVREYLEASAALRKRVLATKDGPTKFLIKAGILTKDGKRLAKPYR